MANLKILLTLFKVFFRPALLFLQYPHIVHISEASKRGKRNGC